MRRDNLILLLSFFVWVSCTTVSQPNQDEQEFFDLIDAELTGDLAHSTTAYVEQYWRLVGNAGFDSSVYEVARHLEKAGYVLESKASKENQLTYRIEKRPLQKPTWEPVDAKVMIDGDDTPLLEFVTNRNMIAINSYSTAEKGISARVVYISDAKLIGKTDVRGKIVFAEAYPYRILKAAVEGGAVGLITYSNPDYLQPEKNTTSIQFRSIPRDEEQKPWSIALSYQAKEKLKKKMEEGDVTLHVTIETKIYNSEELTVVADIQGIDKPDERLVFSAHVQEPGANDNASGVGVALEMAAVTARLVKEGHFAPKRTITFLWGDEITSTARYVEEASSRATNIKWGISLDMVGENTDMTGGSFLIEKMPDPSAIWTRGKDKHTEWGASDITLNDMKPHYLNDFVTKRFMEQGKRADWKVNTNPFEGGSDHVPFLDADIPGVLFWHFTDQFYHTDNDRIDKVSKSTLKNVGTAALVCAYTLVNGDERTAWSIMEEVKSAGVARLEEELKQGHIALDNGGELAQQIEIIAAWKDWYVKAIATCSDLVEDSSVDSIIKDAQQVINRKAEDCMTKLESR